MAGNPRKHRTLPAKIAKDCSGAAPTIDASEAVVTPTLARCLLRVLKERGYALSPFYRGLGFQYSDLFSDDFRLSYKQIRALIVRVLRRVDDPLIGIAAGACQSPLSWGSVGLGLLTCGTLGEAIQLALRYQAEAGAVVEYRMTKTVQTVSCEVLPKYPDPEIEGFLVEHSLASSLTIGRFLTDPSYAPLHVEFAFPANGHESGLIGFFGCPVYFNRQRNRMVFDIKWLKRRLRGYDPFACETLQKSLVALFPPKNGNNTLIEALTNHIGQKMGYESRQADVAAAVNMSERTMRRRLRSLGTSFRSLDSKVSYERAVKLLQRADLSINQISEKLGYSSVRAFRRAFYRWSGLSPTAFRKTLSGRAGDESC